MTGSDMPRVEKRWGVAVGKGVVQRVGGDSLIAHPAGIDGEFGGWGGFGWVAHRGGIVEKAREETGYPDIHGAYIILLRSYIFSLVRRKRR